MAGICLRCAAPKVDGRHCGECGVSYDRKVRRRRGRRTIGGKRGRNSGTTNKSKTK